MPEKIYVLIDHRDDKAQTPSLEALAMAQKLAADTGYSLHGLLLGHDLRSVGQRVAKYRADSVLLIQSDRLKEYDPDAYCAALKQIVSEDQPHLLVMAHTYQNIDLAPKLAAALNRALVTDAIGYRREGEELMVVRQMFRNKLNAEIRFKSEHPWLVTTQAGAVSADELEQGAAAEIVERPVDLSSVEIRRKPLEIVQLSKGKLDLGRADMIVGVGRGIKSQDNLRIIEELAEALGAEIAASRPVVDNEWMERERQVGSSGQSVSPRLYIACGISGAIQHVVGMKNSGCIVAINSDPNAPIFNIATYGIMGDLLEIVPALTKKLREGRAAH
ncbi:MAG: electron transfer flavoprotein subunit alpha/FixB family protein [Acidobacteriota bacterium]